MPPSNTPKIERMAMGHTLKCGMPECGSKYPHPPCEHLNAWLEAGYDAPEIMPTDSVIVYATHGNKLHLPSLPWIGWTRVDVGTQLKGGFKEIKLNHSRMNSTKVEISLGLMSEFDGRFTLAQQIMDAVLGRLDPRDRFSSTGDLHTKCATNLHSPRQEKEKKLFERRGNPERMKMMFSLALEGACIPCLNDAYGEGDGSDDNYGLDRAHKTEDDDSVPFDRTVAAQQAATDAAERAIQYADLLGQSPNILFPVGSKFRGGTVISAWQKSVSPSYNVWLIIQMGSGNQATIDATQAECHTALKALRKVPTPIPLSSGDYLIQTSHPITGYEFMGGLIVASTLYVNPRKLELKLQFPGEPGQVIIREVDLEVEEQFYQLHQHLKAQGYRG